LKVLSSELLAHYASDATTLARLWKITRRDGEVFAFTDHDVAIAYSAVTYEPSSVFDASAINTSHDLNVDGLEAQGLLDSEGITAADLEAGLWDAAAVEIVEVNYKDLTMGHNPLRYGTLGEVQRSVQTFTAELRGLMYALQQNIGRTVLPSCDATLGDARCGVDLEALRVSGEVTVATSNRVFTTDVTGSDTYTYGVLTWTTGLNDGRSMEVKMHASAVMTLQIAMPYAVQVGDEFTVTPGCDKTEANCKLYSNFSRFRGFPDVPGTDAMLRGGQ
jgi:uncharacterized phage protein (TIGR02218 family)